MEPSLYVLRRERGYKEARGLGPARSRVGMNWGICGGLGADWKVRPMSGLAVVLGVRCIHGAAGLRTLQDAHRPLEGQQSVAPRQWGFARQQWEHRNWPWRPLPRGSVGETFWQRIRRNQEVDEGRRAPYGLLRWRWNQHSFAAP